MASTPIGNGHVILAVRLIVPDAAGRVLVLRRRPGAQRGGEWSLPGGKADYGETVEKAVIRELREETGLGCEAPLFLFYQDSLPFEPGGMHCVNLCFECPAVGEVRLNEESTACAWIDAAELDAYRVTFRGDEALRRYWATRKRSA